MSDTLKPCPFCGKQPLSRWFGAFGEDDDITGQRWSVRGSGYWGIECCQAFSHAGTEEDAVYHWNRRAAERAALAQPQNDAEACALAHITLEDDGPYIKLEVLDGTNLQPEMSPVRLFTSPPPPELERMRKALEHAKLVLTLLASPSFRNGDPELEIESSLARINNALSRAGDNHASDLCQQCRKRKADRIFLDNTCTFHICGDCWSTNRDERDNHASDGKECQYIGPCGWKE